MSDAAYPDALPALSRLHWYVVERVLGQGGFGITYLARDTNLDQRVAIKEYLPVDVATRLQDATVRSRNEENRDRYRWGLERFIQEARTLARFDHPNIVRVHSVFEVNNTAYMVMRFEAGGTLSALLDRRGTLPEPELLAIILPILDGLELVHNAGFIHRDVKPDNIHIDDDGRPVLLDFGSARQALGSAHTLTILVAPGYAPFEQYYSDSASQGPWTDIYGLGATCYRAIAGRAPMDAVSRSKGILGSAQEVMVPATVIGAGRYSGKILSAIDHALAFGEKDRPQTIAQWRKELLEASIVSGVTPRASATVTHHAPPVVARTSNHAITTPSLGDVAGRATAPPSPKPIPAPQPAGYAKTLASRGPLYWALLGAIIVAAGVVAYLAAIGKNDDTRNKIDKLEKQIEEEHKVREAEQNKKKNEQATSKAEQQSPSAPQDAKVREEPASKAGTVVQAHADEAKRQAAPPKALPGSRVSPPSGPSPQAVPTANQTPALPPAASLQPPAAITPQPPIAAAEPPKTTPVRAPTPAEQLADADRAILAKQYAEALAIIKPLAEAGNAQAQSRLGNLYEEGQGVSRDIGTAKAWYEKAADQGDTAAELKLGAMYENGGAVGVPSSYFMAYIWYGLAARQGSGPGKAQAGRVASQMQPAERAQAEKVIENKLNRMGKKP